MPAPQNLEPGIKYSSLLQRILVVKLAGIGDLLTAFPAMEALRKSYPGAEISALVTPQTTSLLEERGLVDRVIVLNKYGFDEASGFLRPGALAGLWGLARQLREHSFDAAILLHHLITWQGVAKYASLMAASGAPLRVGLDDGRGFFLNRKVRDGGFGARHEVEYWLDVVGLLGAKSPDPRVRLTTTPSEERYADGMWAALGLDGRDRVVAIHPGCGSYSPVRRWSAEGFSRVAGELSTDGLIPMVVAGPGEEELAREVAAGISGRSLMLEGVPTPGHLAATLKRCRLFVGNDSGVMQVAFAAGVPVVAVFGMSNHLAWAPYDCGRERSRVVRMDLPCSPCLYRGHSLGLRYGCGDPRCLLRITPAAVTAAARELLSAT